MCVSRIVVQASGCILVYLADALTTEKALLPVNEGGGVSTELFPAPTTAVTEALKPWRHKLNDNDDDVFQKLYRDQGMSNKRYELVRSDQE